MSYDMSVGVFYYVKGFFIFFGENIEFNFVFGG